MKDNRVLSIGYNGGPSNFQYDFDWATPEKYDFCIHSEMNALANSAKVGTNVNGADIYVTLSPCKDCIRALIQAGIKNVYYLNKYKDTELATLIAENSPSIHVEQIRKDD